MVLLECLSDQRLCRFLSFRLLLLVVVVVVTSLFHLVVCGPLQRVYLVCSWE